MLKSMDISERIKDIGEVLVGYLSEMSRSYKNMDISKDLNSRSSESNIYIVRL